MEFNKVYNHERVTRKFTSRKVNEKLLAKIIQRAQLSPSLLNSQPWKVYMLTGDALSGLKKEVKTQIDNNVEPHEDFVKMLSLNWDSYPSQNMAAVGASQPYFFNNKMELFSESNNNMFNAQDVAFLMKDYQLCLRTQWYLILSWCVSIVKSQRMNLWEWQLG